SSDRTVKLWSRDGQLLQTLEGHSDSVLSVSFSPDGKTLASASADRTVKLWSRDGQLLQTLAGHSDSVLSVSFSPDGKTLASASSDRTVKLWSRDGQLLQTLEGHSDSVLSVSFSPDGKTLASASSDRTVKLWSRDGQLLQTLEGHSASISSVSFSPDGKTLASASSDRTVKLWNFNRVMLTELGCDWLANYLIQHPEVLSALKDCHTTQRLEASALVLVEKAKTLAERGQVEDAKKLLKMAKAWHPAIDLFPETADVTDSQVNQVANRLAIPFQLKEAKRLAREGLDQEAIAVFEKIQKLQPNTDLDPTTAEIESDPKAIVDPLMASFLVETGQTLVRQGEVEEAIAAYQQAQTLVPEGITAWQWNSLCWYGSLHRQAAKVMFACDKAVTLDPSHGGRINSRGLARALTGQNEGAIADFQFFVKWTDDKEQKQQRQAWIQQLQSGKDPFTDEVLNELKNE
ncbi:MAG: hypothetical protein F6K19_33425, partial [Cyanothece sp. SIO1E1]|nr:hypothetical protein [Cyanothece sp. SIO1E1]